MLINENKIIVNRTVSLKSSWKNKHKKTSCLYRENNT